MSSAPIVLDQETDLFQVPARAWATVTDVCTEPEDQMRLMGLGICAGRRLRLLKQGDPLILQVYGTRIGLSARLARRVRVMLHGRDADAR